MDGWFGLMSWPLDSAGECDVRWRQRWMQKPFSVVRRRPASWRWLGLDRLGIEDVVSSWRSWTFSS